MDYTKIMIDNLDNIEIVKKCLEKGADVHADENVALRAASWDGDTEMVEMLLDAGADVTACDNEALWYASFFSYPDMVKLLKQYGAKE